MSKIAVNEITDEQGSGRPSFTNGVQTSNINGGQVGGRRNLIINGGMQVAQRGTSVTSVTSSGYYTCDRLKVDGGGFGTWTVEQSSDAPSQFQNSFKMTCTTANSSPTAGNIGYLNYKIEAQDLASLSFGNSEAKSFAVSFYVKSNKTGVAQLNIYNSDSGRVVSQTYSIQSANTWERKVITFPGDIAGSINNYNGPGFNIWWPLVVGSTYTGGSIATTWQEYSKNLFASAQNINFADSTSNTFAITGVQLEVGDTATEFEHRSYGEELALCQRYYQEISLGIGTQDEEVIPGVVHYTSSAQYIPYRFTLEMRAAPSCSSTTVTDGYRIYGAATSGDVNNIDSFQRINKRSVRIQTTATGYTAGDSGWLELESSGAKISFDAEL